MSWKKVILWIALLCFGIEITESSGSFVRVHSDRVKGILHSVSESCKRFDAPSTVVDLLLNSQTEPKFILDETDPHYPKSRLFNIEHASTGVPTQESPTQRQPTVKFTVFHREEPDEVKLKSPLRPPIA